jgi:hypothetical protein
MTSLPATRPPRQRKPPAPVNVVGRFAGGATDRGLEPGAAAPEIEDVAAGTLTSCRCKSITHAGQVLSHTPTHLPADGGGPYDVGTAGLPCRDRAGATRRPGAPAPTVTAATASVWRGSCGRRGRGAAVMTTLLIILALGFLETTRHRHHRSERIFPIPARGPRP